VHAVYLARVLAKRGNVDLATTLLDKAVAGGEPSASTQLGFLVKSHVIKKEQRKEPRQYFEDAAARDDPEALVQLGFIEESESTAAVAKQKAFSLYARAAERGYYAGAAAVGFAYERGVGVPVDLVTAARWYYRAAELGDDWSLIRLAVMVKAGEPRLDSSSWAPRIADFVTHYQARRVILQDLLRACSVYNPTLEPTIGRVRRNADLSPQQKNEILAL
jgi:TPR repeat protein